MVGSNYSLVSPILFKTPDVAWTYAFSVQSSIQAIDCLIFFLNFIVKPRTKKREDFMFYEVGRLD